MKYTFFYNNVLYAGRGSVVGAYTAKTDDYDTAEGKFWEYMETHSQWGDEISFSTYDENGNKVGWCEDYIIDKKINDLSYQRPLHFVCYLFRQKNKDKCEFKTTVEYYDNYEHAQKQAENRYKDYLIDNMKNKVKSLAAKGKYGFNEYLDYYVAAKAVLRTIEEDIAEVCQ